MARDVSNYGNKEAKSLPKPLTDDFTTKEKAQKSNVDRGVEKVEPSYTAGERAKRYIHFRKLFGSSSKTLGKKFPHEPVPLLLGIRPKRTENICPYKNLYSNVIPLRIAKMWQQSKCPSTDE